MLILRFGNKSGADHRRDFAATAVAGGREPEKRLAVSETVYVIRTGCDCNSGHHIGFPAQAGDREETNARPEHGLVVAEGSPGDAGAWIEIMVIRRAEPGREARLAGILHRRTGQSRVRKRVYGAGVDGVQKERRWRKLL